MIFSAAAKHYFYLCTMDKEKWIVVFATLGDRLATFGADEPSRQVIRDALAANPWFTEADITFSISAIRKKILAREALAAWLAGYSEIPAGHGKSLGIIMAGNIPAVGFADLMYGLICGYRCHIKTSSKDSHIIRYIVYLLKEICNDLPIFFTVDNAPDALIATGSDNTIRHLRVLYPESKSLFRGSRSSIAVLSGCESEAELQLLASDIFTYSGLGCRNVSLIFVPEGYDITRLTHQLAAYPSAHPKYCNNYLQNKVLLQMTGVEFIDGGFFLMRCHNDFPLQISEIDYTYYSDLQEVRNWIAAHDEQLQCVVSECIDHQSIVAFGESQFPGPGDYPDRRDVVDFLCRAATSGRSDCEIGKND